MKRPLPIYFVAAWCFVGLAVQVSGLSRVVAPYLAQGQASAEVRNTLSGVGGVLVIWHVVRLIQLKSLNRWISIVFFSLWTVTLIWNSFVLAHRLERPFRPVAVFLAFCLLNVGSVWYLTRGRFRDFAVQFVSERENEKHSRMMQKISRKRVQSGL
jgi:hypothetical protein